MKIIRVPRVTKRAFDPRRKASDLLRHQVVQLEYVVTRLKGTDALKRSASRVRTEAQAASFVADAMELLKLVPTPPPATPPAPADRAPTRTRTVRTTRKRTAAARKATKRTASSRTRKTTKKTTSSKRKKTTKRPAKKKGATKKVTKKGGPSR